MYQEEEEGHTGDKTGQKMSKFKRQRMGRKWTSEVRRQKALCPQDPQNNNERQPALEHTAADDATYGPSYPGSLRRPYPFDVKM